MGLINQQPVLSELLLVSAAVTHHLVRLVEVSVRGCGLLLQTTGFEVTSEDREQGRKKVSERDYSLGFTFSTSAL